MLKKIKKFHFVGIGGEGMSGIAEVMLNLGYEVSGSDLKQTSTTKRLQNLGAKIFYNHIPSNINNTEVVVYSSAIPKDNPEITAAKKKNLPVIPRIEMLTELARLKYSVTIAGTHGKTTTTSMIGLLLKNANLSPTLIIGGRLKNINSNAHLGEGDFIVVEVDESDGSFLKISSTISVITNIDNDHLDFWKDIENLYSGFVEYANRVPFYGCVCLNIDDSGIQKIFHRIHKKVFSYGINPDADFSVRNIKLQNKYEFDIYYKNNCEGRFSLKVFGRHNIINALGAFSVGKFLEIDNQTIKKTFEEFEGVGRRIEIKGEKNNILFLDDYAHHPTEIKATLDAIKERYPQRRILVIFQPHRYTRTKILYKEFGNVFNHADKIWITEIYPAGEEKISGINSQLIIDEIKKKSKNVESFNGIDDILKELKNNDILLTLGAGDVYKFGEEILKKI